MALSATISALAALSFWKDSSAFLVTSRCRKLTLLCRQPVRLSSPEVFVQSSMPAISCACAAAAATTIRLKLSTASLTIFSLPPDPSAPTARRRARPMTSTGPSRIRRARSVTPPPADLQLRSCRYRREDLERVKGIEPSSSAWKAVALPLSYTRTRNSLHTKDRRPTLADRLARRRASTIKRLRRASLRPRLASRSAEGAKAGGGGRTRTYEGVSQRIYSPPPLPLGTLPRRLTLHPDGCIQGRQGRFYGEPMAQCKPRLPGARKQGRPHASTASTPRPPTCHP